MLTAACADTWHVALSHNTWQVMRLHVDGDSTHGHAWLRGSGVLEATSHEPQAHLTSPRRAGGRTEAGVHGRAASTVLGPSRRTLRTPRSRAAVMSAEGSKVEDSKEEDRRSSKNRKASESDTAFSESDEARVPTPSDAAWESMRQRLAAYREQWGNADAPVGCLDAHDSLHLPSPSHYLPFTSPSHAGGRRGRRCRAGPLVQAAALVEDRRLPAARAVACAGGARLLLDSSL